MKIIEANIIQFGKFKDEIFRFEDGFNIVKGDNESGKSTLLGFIKFALYGLARKNPSVTVGERERALSWGTGIAVGSLTVEDENGRKYRIERSGREGARGTYVDKVRVIDLENGNEVFADEIPGEHFLGISAQAYDNMCNIKQLETVVVGGEAIKGAIDNLLSTGDENTNVQAALKSLDAERRRLMHTNGRGGLVFESATKLERLKGEHKSAILFENECVKNIDELDRVEISLLKAREEHGIAQKMCDLHDDVLRLQKFDKLRELMDNEKQIIDEMSALDGELNFDVNLATYERAAEISGAAESLSRSKNALELAQNELKNTENALSNVTFDDGDELSLLLEEFGSPKSAESYYRTKEKKAKQSLGILVVLLVLGVGLVGFAGVLAIGMSNLAGAMTILFMALIMLFGATTVHKKYKSANDDKKAFLEKAGLTPQNAREISRRLEEFNRSRGVIVQRKNAHENAKFRLLAAEDNFEAGKQRAAKYLAEFGAENIDDEALTLQNIATEIKNHLAKKQEIEAKRRENSVLAKSLMSELERFSESDIRARITPEIEEKIKDIPFDRLKTERDAALQRTNQLSQYKAGIERNLASSEGRRSSSEIFPEIYKEKQNYQTLSIRLDAIKLAMETVNAASLEMKSDITPKIKERAQENLSLATEGKYNELFVDENMKLSVYSNGETRPVEALSRGSLDVAYFSLRLSLVQTLLADKNPPLYMDECLSQLDDGRAKNTLSALFEHSKSAQCILFTCQGRDVELAKELGEINLIELGSKFAKGGANI